MSPGSKSKAKTADDENFRWQKSRDERRRLDRHASRNKTSKPLSDNALEATVLCAVGPLWLVSTQQQMVLCTIAGTVDSPHTNSIVAVGDRVWITMLETATEHGHAAGLIVKVNERDTVLSRRAAGRVKREQVVVSNVNQIGIVMSCLHPSYNKRLIDRYLIAADKGDLAPFIIINKMDLLSEEERAFIREDLSAYWADLELPVLFVSAETGENLNDLRSTIANTSSLLAGPSGVGKSSIINRLTEAQQRVGDISKMYDKGKHTTTAAVVLPLREGGLIVDSPGIREFGIWELDKEELPFYFGEFVELMHNCKFAPCSHTHEPDCAIKTALEEGIIDPDRYVSYLALLEEIDTPDLRH